MLHGPNRLAMRRPLGSREQLVASLLRSIEGVDRGEYDEAGDDHETGMWTRDAIYELAGEVHDLLRALGERAGPRPDVSWRWRNKHQVPAWVGRVPVVRLCRMETPPEEMNLAERIENMRAGMERLRSVSHIAGESSKNP